MAKTGKDGKVRFGLIGCGEIAVRSLEAILIDKECSVITAVQDVNEPLAKDAGQKAGAPHFTDVAKLLERDDVDAVVISTPHFLHAPLTIQAAKAGKHVACEKPIACTLEEADAMIAACKATGVLLSINYVTRYDAPVKMAAELLASGAIGKVIRFQAHVAADKPESYWSGGYTGRNKSDWRQSKEKSGGGVLIMNLIHDIDRVHQIAGLKPIRVFAECDTHCTPVEVEDNISVTIRYENGAIGSIDAMSCARGTESFGNRLYGTDGQLVLSWPLRVFTTKDVPGLKKKEWTTVEAPGKQWGPEGRAEYFARFAREILKGSSTCDVPGEEARKSLAVAVAAYESAATHKAVSPR
ncbi:MAG: Gfo/Idh/MocA family oxidoreductase [Planctomycetes bacterium]|nr:Gfo/Idh/MocA family oxidoreductase [Planctomycetota bacterium]